MHGTVLSMCASRHGCARRLHGTHVPTEMHHSAMLQPKHMRTPCCMASKMRRIDTLPTMRLAQSARLARECALAPQHSFPSGGGISAPICATILQAHLAQASSTRCTVPMMCRSGAVPSCHPCSPCAMRSSLKLIRLHRCLLRDAAVHPLSLFMLGV